MKKLISILVAFAMMATLAVTMAFAEGEINETGHAYFTKTWATNADVSTPAKTFSFTINQVTDPQVDPQAVTNSVPLTANDISFAKDETGTKTSNDLLAGKTWKNSDNKVVPGKYVYTITENIPDATGTEQKTGNVITDTSTNGTATTTKKTTYSNKTYTMEVFVNKNGQVEAVVVKDGTNKVTSDEPATGAANGFNFKNTYSETVSNTPTGTEEDEPGTSDGKSLAIEKEISARDGYIDTDQGFLFSTTVTFPTVDPAAQYKAYVIDEKGDKVGSDIIFDADHLTNTYTLKHGYRLFFENIDLGATWTATEDLTGVDGYTKEGEQTNAETVKASGNNTKVVNTYTKAPEVPDEGLLVANLPYIALALVAIGGLVAYVVVRRKADDEA